MKRTCPICDGPVAKITKYECLAADKHPGWKPSLRLSVAKVPNEPNPLVQVSNLQLDGRPIQDTLLGPDDMLTLMHTTVGTFYLTRFKPIVTDSLRKLAKRHRLSALRTALEQLITKEQS